MMQLRYLHLQNCSYLHSYCYLTYAKPHKRFFVFIALASSERSDMPAHTHSLVRAFSSLINKILNVDKDFDLLFYL